MPAPDPSVIVFPSFADSQSEVCGIYSVEDAAITMYDTLHGYPAGATLPTSNTASATIAGYAESMLEDLASAAAVGDTSGMTADDWGAYDWLESVDNAYQLTEAQDAVNEYNRWASEQCNYRPPSPYFTYNPSGQLLCQGGSGSPYAANFHLTPPSYQEFVEYGDYDAAQALDIDTPFSQIPDGDVVDDAITAGIGTATTVVAGAAPQALAAVEAGAGQFSDFLQFISPKAYGTITKATTQLKMVSTTEQAGRVLQQTENNASKGSSDADLANIGEGTDIADLEDAGVEWSAVAEAGADLASGFAVVAAIAVTLAVLEAVEVITAAEIPTQLQANLTAAQQAAADPTTLVNNLVDEGNGQGAVFNLDNYEQQLDIPPITVGQSPSACSGCTIFQEPPAAAAASDGVPQIQVTALNANGTPTSWQWTSPTVSGIDTWPLGVDDGAYGPPEVSLGLDDGVAWTEQGAGSPPTDETTDGLSGYLPSGEFDYFNAAGRPEIAYIDGDDFNTLTSPGSASAGGTDAGDNCATPGECTLSSSIVVMADGGTAQLQDELQPGSFLGQSCTANDPGPGGPDCLSDNLLPDGDLVPLGGSTSQTQTGDLTQVGTGLLFRLTIVPDTGTPPATLILNQYGNIANDRLDGSPDGGLVAGQSVTLSDPDTNPLGYSSTYTWQIETKCPYDPANPPAIVEGVTVCSNSPDYGHRNLPADEQDLAYCPYGTAPGSCITFPTDDYEEDPAFHGDPVTTITGQNVTWTFPAPGTYHIRLLTTDQYGVVQQSDQDVVVSAPAPPSVSLSYGAASGSAPTAIYPSVIGPVLDGDALTVTGCVSSPDDTAGGDYSTPQVTVSWGDGTTPDTGSVASDTDPNLTFSYEPGGSCPSAWAFSATHTYDVPTGLLPVVQQQISVSVGDVTIPPTPSDLVPPGTETTSALAIAADVTPPTLGPAFVDGSSTKATFDVGSPTTYTGYLTGIPAATITDAPATGVSEGSTGCAPGLPGGVALDTFDDNTFVITGTPGVGEQGCYALTVSANNGNGSAEESLIVDVDQSPAVTSSPTTSMATGAPGTYTFTSSGFPTGSWHLVSVSCTPQCGSSLPADLSFTDNGDGTATLSSDGVPLAAADAGTYTLTVRASNTAGSATQTFTLVVGGAPVFTSSPSAGFTTQEDGSFTISTKGYPVAALSCSIDYEGTTTGCTTGLGYTLIDTDFNNYGLYFTDNGNGTATLAGAPYASGAFTLTVTATNAVGSTTQTFTLYASNTGGSTVTFVDTGSVTQYQPPEGDVPAVADAVWEVGTPGSVTMCSDDPGDVFSLAGSGVGQIGTLPAGLTLTNGDGSGCPGGDASATVSGTPVTPPTGGGTGNYPDRVVTGSNGLGLLDITLVGPPTVTSPPIATFTEGQAGSFTVTQGTDPTAQSDGCFALEGSLPNGLTFSDNGDGTATLSGTPTVSGQFSATVEASDCQGTTAVQTLTIDIQSPPQITSAPSAGFTVGQGGTFTVTTDGDAYPTPAFTAAPLPAGVTFSDNGDGTGTLSVAADAPATDIGAVVTVTATSSAGTTSQDLIVTIGSPVAITSPPSTSASVTFVVGQPASYGLTSTGFPVGTYSCTVSGSPCSSSDLPAGLSFTDNGDGTATLSGTPTAVGTTTIEVSVDNGVNDAATTLDVAVDSPPTFAGTSTSGDCGSPSSATTDTFSAGSSGQWTICSTGSPAPSVTLAAVTCAGAPTSLPAGLSFTDNGDGTASVSGDPQNGAGAACPSGYVLTVSLANGAGSVTTSMTLMVEDEIVATSAPDEPVFVAGAADSYTLTASGVPTPSFSEDPGAALPSWLTLTDGGDGSARLSGNPPLADAGTTLRLDVDETNGVDPPVADPVNLTIAAVAFTAASPPEALLGEHYSYAFGTTSPAVFSVASGDTLPLGLHLSAAGVLSGVPTELGRFPVRFVLTQGTTTTTTPPIDLIVGVPAHALEITQFRSFGPRGWADWFVQVRNMTRTAIPLDGWSVGVVPFESTVLEQVPLGHGVLAPGQAALVVGPSFSMTTLGPPTAVGPEQLAVPGGFSVVAPNGVITDVAGEAGAPAAAVAGTGVSFPARVHVAHQEAFVRRGLQWGHPKDTNDNAADFVFKLARLSQTVTFTSNPPKPAVVGGSYALSASGGGSGAPVTFHIASTSSSGSCTLRGTIVDFTGVGWCVILARQEGGAGYQSAPPASQTVRVEKAPQSITFTSKPPNHAEVGDTYVVSATGGGSGKPVTFTAGTGPTPGVCTVSGTTIDLVAAGTCVVVAHQAGGASYLSAKAKQVFHIYPDL